MRVLRTFAFADLSGFTNYTTEHGDDAAGRVLSEFLVVTRRLASERGVRVAKWLGDGCMVVAIDQEDMVAFVLDLEREATAACDPLSPPHRRGDRSRPALRGRRLHRLRREPGRPPL